MLFAIETFARVQKLEEQIAINILICFHVQKEAETEDGDMLPGLYKVAQQWVDDVAASAFPELHASGTSFDAWFGHHKVMMHLSVRRLETAPYFTWTLQPSIHQARLTRPSLDCEAL